jgi:hypothetical protein
MAARPHASRKAPGRSRSGNGGSGVAGVFKGKMYFYFQKIISLFEKP